VDARTAERALARDRDETQARLAAMTADLAAVSASSTNANLDDEHDPEGSTVAFEREQLAALRRQAEDHLAELDAALTRVADGTYGICQSCHGPVGEERLAALPAARFCVRCAAAAARRVGAGD